MQMPVVVLTLRVKDGSQRLYVVEKKKRVLYDRFQDWFEKVLAHKMQNDVQQIQTLTKKELNAVCQLSSSEADRLLIKYAACQAAGLSQNKAESLYGIDKFKVKRDQVTTALQKACEIRQCVSELANIEDRAVLQSVGLDVESDDSCLDSELETDTESDRECNVQFTADSSDMDKDVSDVDQSETWMDTGLTDPDSGLSKSVAIANPAPSNDVLLSWLREVNLNWFAFVHEVKVYLRMYTAETADQVLLDFSEFIPESDLSEGEEKTVEVSRQAYLDFCRRTVDEDKIESDSDSNSDPEQWLELPVISDKMAERVNKERQKIKRRKIRTVAKEIANQRLLKRKTPQAVCRILAKYPNIGKDIEDYVSSNRVGADQWRRTGVLTFKGNKTGGTKVTYKSIQEFLENLYNDKFSYGTIVQLCVVRNKRHISAKRYKGIANVTCRKARKGFTIKLNPDSHWSSANYKSLDWLQLQDGRNKVLLNRDDQAGFRLDTTSTHSHGKTVSLRNEPSLTTRTDFVNDYKSVLQTTSYLFMESKTTPCKCIGVVKPHFSYPKNPSQHMADLMMLENDTEGASVLKDKEIDCIRVDGASDEGPSHSEVQFLWTERHLHCGKTCTIVSTRESGGSYLNKVELMNGFIAKAHDNLFIPSTLCGSNKTEQGLDAQKIAKNMDAATDVYISRVNGAPCLGTELIMRKGAKDVIATNLQDRRSDLLTFLKGKPAQKKNLEKEKRDLYEHFSTVWALKSRHTVVSTNYLFVLLPCFEEGCIHPICQKGRIRSGFDECTWFEGGPKLGYIPMPIPDPSRPWGGTCKDCLGNCSGHYLKPEDNYVYQCHLRDDELKDLCLPPGQRIKNFAQMTQDPTDSEVEELAKKCLLPIDEVFMHLQQIRDIAARRKIGAEKARETKRKKKTVSSEPVFCWCKGPEEGEMIHCDGESCTIGWFHFPCVGIQFAPVGTWFCPDCQCESITFCLCNQGEIGNMVECANSSCRIGFFHRECVGLRRVPKAWKCDSCKELT